MSETEGTTAAPESASTNSAGPYVNDQGDALEVARPEWMSDDQWRELREVADDYFARLVGQSVQLREEAADRDC